MKKSHSSTSFTWNEFATNFLKMSGKYILCCRSHSLACFLVCSANTSQLVEKYEKQCQRFMASSTVRQFKQLFQHLPHPPSCGQERKLSRWGLRMTGAVRLLTIWKSLLPLLVFLVAISTFPKLNTSFHQLFHHLHHPQTCHTVKCTIMI